jgi:DNA (cytosine-5)-methyltransferase 1
MLTFGAIAHYFKARWIVWENVPGVLSSNGGRDFGTFLGMLAELGYGFAYRVLDAQYFGVPQRRRRVFVVGHLGDWTGPAKVLFDEESLSGNPPPRRDEGQGVAAYAEGSFGAYREGEVGTLKASGGALAGGSETLIAFNAQASVSQGLSAGGKSLALDASKVHAICMASRQQAMSIGEDVASPILGTDFKKPQVVCYPIDMRNVERGDEKTTGVGIGNDGDPAYTVTAARKVHAVCYEHHGNDSRIREAGDTSPTITSRAGTGGNNLPILCLRECAGKPGGGKGPLVSNGVSLALATGNDQAVCFQQNMLMDGGASMHIRRFTPRECERLQGFPDDWAKIPWNGKDADDCPDSHRYKACGNSMAVPVMRWIGERIQAVEDENKKERLK